jgi:hypothetical protein
MGRRKEPEGNRVHPQCKNSNPFNYGSGMNNKQKRMNK